MPRNDLKMNKFNIQWILNEYLFVNVHKIFTYDFSMNIGWEVRRNDLKMSSFNIHIWLFNEYLIVNFEF